MTRALIFSLLMATAIPFQTFARGGTVNVMLSRFGHRINSVVYTVHSQIDLTLLPDDSN